MPDQNSTLSQFEANLRDAPYPLASIRDGQIGKDTFIDGPAGRHKMIYADYVASGRPLRQIEDFVMSQVLPFYANSHTEASFCGATMTHMREDARQIIATKCGANLNDHAVIFSGSGATSGLNQLVHLFDVPATLAQGKAVKILMGPYEHHSNILPWRESGASVVEIREGVKGGPDMEHLEAELRSGDKNCLTIVAFSAASNVTGICADVAAITTLVKSYDALMVWDYAGGGPYLPIAMSQTQAEIDAIALSPHKFIGGPAASGVLIVRRDAVRTHRPSRPGGGTVSFVNAHQHDYVPRIEQREEGGTPNVIGDIRAALAFIVKDVIGQDYMTSRNANLAHKAFAIWGNDPCIEILAPNDQDRLPFLSFVPRSPDGQRLNYQTFTRALSDLYGIQARGGCSCAGPYVHRLMGIDDAWSDQLRTEILAGDTSRKPGFVRLNLSVLMDDDTVDFILGSVAALTRRDLACAA
ncbi:aminotransferase class V-fold PLP-dependent enzyme [Shimia litoralis]|uniref:Aminotransferase class V-fold PLP-dependent enzyme n=1 Tax=Shimia litoralis TaxID=420403 RepID=A0A4U7N235_9RHOB|nr:aminotransferase class V-fold PLP-dependent enzyme [Shimia litoralis]TKZ19226.1 aminotransferase class V-fold PLP-dependent enzyme [Shimia litoralis]